ncbi:MAG: hypothetical protein AAGD13_04275 [Pseudomonadota bacterium]
MRTLLKILALTATLAALSALPAGSGATGQLATEPKLPLDAFEVTVDRNPALLSVEAVRSELDHADVTMRVAHADFPAPVSLTLSLWDGEELRFALPGDFETRYRVIRSGNLIHVGAEAITFLDSVVVD